VARPPACPVCGKRGRDNANGCRACADTYCCSACGKRFQPDPDDPPLVNEVYPVCDDTCATCPRCGGRFRHEGLNPVGIAESDELAAKYDPCDMGACQMCWDYVKKHGEWPK
jgi:predicted nucleic acid-binding Zn ribbon protein